MNASSPFRRRTYLHFDKPISEEKARAMATNPTTVESRGFLPMLRCDIKVNKIVRMPGNRHKPAEKIRPICYSSHHDAAIYSFYAKTLSDLYEAEAVRSGISEVVTALRANAGRCNIHAAKEVFDSIRVKGDCLVLAFDIQAFVDTLVHKQLKRK